MHMLKFAQAQLSPLDSTLISRSLKGGTAEQTAKNSETVGDILIDIWKVIRMENMT